TRVDDVVCTFQIFNMIGDGNRTMSTDLSHDSRVGSRRSRERLNEIRNHDEPGNLGGRISGGVGAGSRQGFDVAGGSWRVNDFHRIRAQMNLNGSKGGDHDN